jgi:hypothetical protein
MTKDDIRNLATWRNSYELELKCFPPVFDKSVNVQILTKEQDHISDRSVQIINDLLGLSVQDLEIIKDYLWEDCKLNCEISNYGFDIPAGKTEQEVNHEEFGVLNREDAYAKSDLKYLLVCEDDQDTYTNNYGFLTFDNEWNGHLTVVVMKNGYLVGCGDSGLYLGKYEA